jgi:hypothetical protein
MRHTGPVVHAAQDNEIPRVVEIFADSFFRPNLELGIPF